MLDVLIVGSGPAGLSAAIYAKRANLSAEIAEKIFMGTGQVAESGRVDNYLGMPGISGYELGEAFRGHAEAFEIPFREAEVSGFERTENGWRALLADGESMEAKGAACRPRQTCRLPPGFSHRKAGCQTPCFPR